MGSVLGVGWIALGFKIAKKFARFKCSSERYQKGVILEQYLFLKHTLCLGFRVELIPFFIAWGGYFEVFVFHIFSTRFGCRKSLKFRIVLLNTIIDGSTYWALFQRVFAL